jgi:tetratricopeptide (TPR) repeat protein
VPATGVTIKCPKCSHTFVAKREDGGAVPLPGKKGDAAVALPGRKSSAVALPGTSKAKKDIDDMDSLDGDLDLGLDDDLPGPTSSKKDLPGLPKKTAPKAKAAPDGQSLADSGVLDFIEKTHEKAGAPSMAGGAETELRIRRRNGRVEGPYGLGRIMALIRNGELQGNEDISTDGIAWRAMTSHPELNDAINQAAGAADQMGFGNVDIGAGGGGGDMDLGLEADAPSEPAHAPQPRGSSLDKIMDDLDIEQPADDGHGGGHGHGGGGGHGEAEPGEAPAERPKKRGDDELEVGDIPELPPIWQTYRKPILIFAGVIVAVLTGVFTQLFTPYGAFGIKGLVAAVTSEEPPPEPVKPPPPPAKVADPKEIASLIDEHSYEAFRSVFATIASAGPELPDNMLAAAKARGFASLAYGTALFPVDELKKSVDALNTVDLGKALGGNTAAANVEILKARSALEILTGQAESAASQLAGQLEQRSDDKELALLLGLARFKSKDVDGALEALDKAIVASPTYAPALHAIGDAVAVSDSPNAADDAAVWYLKALEAQPAHSRSGVMAGAIFRALNRLGDRRRTLAITASKADRGLPDVDRPAFLFSTAEAFDDAGILSDPRAVTAASEAARLDPTNNKFVALAAAALAESGKVQEGLEQVMNALRRAPQDNDLLIARARVYFAMDDVAKAFLDLDAAKKGTDHRVPLWEARFHMKLGKLTDARGAIARAIKLTTTDPMPLVELGQIDLSVGDVDAALESAKKAVEIAPSSPRSHILLANCYIRRNQLDEAAKTYEMAKTFDDESFDAKIGYANTLRDMSLRTKNPAQATTLAEAMPIYLAALNENARNPTVLFEYGRALEIQGNLGTALALYREATVIDEKDVRPHLKIVAAYLEAEPPDLDAANRSLKIAQKIELAAGQRNAEVRFWEARHALLDKRPSDAVQAMRNAVEQEPRNANYHYWMGVTLEKAESVYEAITAYEKAISLNSRLAEAHRALGWTSVERHQFDKARDSFEKYRESRPEDPTIWVDIGESFAKQNNDRKAMEAFETAIKHQPKNGRALLAVGNILSRQGEEKQAAKYYERAVKADETHGEAWCQLGISKSRGKLTPDARRALEKCIKIANSPEDMRDTAKSIIDGAG